MGPRILPVQSRRPAHADGASHGGRLMSRSLAVPVGLPFASAFKKDPTPLSAGPVLGNARAELAARRIKGVHMRRSAATHRRQQSFVAPTTIVGSHPQGRLSEKQVAEQVAARLEGFSPADLGDVSGRNTETARLWTLAKRAPNSSSMLALGKAIPAIGDFIVSALGRDTGITGALENPQTLGVILSGLQAVAVQGGVNGAIARKLISQLTGGGV